MLPSDTIIAELKKLLHQSSHYLVGLLASLALGFLSFPIFTRVFSVADYGIIDFTQKIVLLFTAASKMGQQNSVLRLYDGAKIAGGREAGQRYYSTLFFGMMATAAAVSLLFGAGVRLGPKSLVDASLYTLSGFAAALIFLKALESVLLSFMRIEERTKAFAFSNVAIKAATVGSVCMLLPLAGSSARTFFSASTTVEAVAVLVLVSLLLRRGVLRLRSFDFSLFRVGLAFGMPLIVYEIAAIVLDSGDRLLVRHYLGADALGQYSVAYGLSSYVNDLLIAPLNLALLPIYMRLWRTSGPQKTAEFLSVGLDLFLMAAAVTLALTTVTAHAGVTLLASSKYSGVAGLIPLIVSGLLVFTTHVFFAAGLLINKNTRVMATLLVLSAILNIGLNCLLLPRYGLKMAAVATLVSYLFCVVLLARRSFKVLPLKIDVRAALRYAVAALAAWFVASQLSFGPPAVVLAARAIAVCTVYGGLLYAFDPRFRAMAAYVWRTIRTGGATHRIGPAEDRAAVAGGGLDIVSGCSDPLAPGS